jgi:hypothetical protein
MSRKKKKEKVRPMPFEDNKGNVRLVFPSNTTIQQMVEMGLVDIRIIPKDQPVPDGCVFMDGDKYFGTDKDSHGQ